MICWVYRISCVQLASPTLTSRLGRSLPWRAASRWAIDPHGGLRTKKTRGFHGDFMGISVVYWGFHMGIIIEFKHPGFFLLGRWMSFHDFGNCGWCCARIWSGLVVVKSFPSYRSGWIITTPPCTVIVSILLVYIYIHITVEIIPKWFHILKQTKICWRYDMGGRGRTLAPKKHCQY